jgi:AI-2 transport protein TqsA
MNEAPLQEEPETHAPGGQKALAAMIMVAAFIILLWGLKWAASFFIPVVAAFFLSVLSYPVMQVLVRRRVPHFVAMLFTVALNVGVVVGLINVVSSLLASFVGRLESYIIGLKASVTIAALWLEAHGVEGAVTKVEDALDWNAVAHYATKQEVMQNFASMLGSTVGTVATVFSEATLVLILMVFILTESRGVTSRVQAVKQAGGPDLTKLLASAGDIQKYLGIKTIISAIGGVLCGIWCWALDVDYPILWGILAFILHFIPAVGAIVAGIPPTLLALVQNGVGTAVAVGIGYLAINFTLGNFIEPTLIGRRFGVSPLVILMSVIFWGWLWGPIGMFLAVPLTIMIKVGLDNSDELRWLAVAMSKKKVKHGEVVMETELFDDADLMGGGAATEPPH